MPTYCILKDLIELPSSLLIKGDSEALFDFEFVLIDPPISLLKEKDKEALFLIYKATPSNFTSLRSDI